MIFSSSFEVIDVFQYRSKCSGKLGDLKMEEAIQPDDYRRRKFKSIHQLLNSKNFKEPLGRDVGSKDFFVVPVPDMNQQGISPKGREALGDDTCQVSDMTQRNFGAQEGATNLADRVVSDLTDRPDDWLKGPEEGDDVRSKPLGCVTDICRSLSDIEPVVNTLLNVASDRRPVALMFVSADDYAEGGCLAMAFAVSLAQRHSKRVLLIDSDFEKSDLTQVFGLDCRTGLSDWLVQNPALGLSVYATDRERVDLVPSGNSPINIMPMAVGNVTRWLKRVAGDYSFICVNAGDAHGVAVNLWSQVAEGTYLSVNRERSSQAIACSAVARIRRLDARLLGCVTNSS